MNTLRAASVAALLAASASAALAAPFLNSSAELVAGGKLKMKVLAGSHGVPPPTPEARMYTVTETSSTGEQTSRVVKKYDENELLYVKEILGTWKDKKGNTMRLAKPDKYPWGEGVEYKTTKAMKDGTTYYIDFQFAEKVAPAAAQKMLKDAAASLSDSVAGMSKGYSSMKWWEQETPQYKFMTDLDKSSGGKFVKDAMRLMEAMRKSYEFYVPKQKDIGVCKVRVFKTLDGYREYRQSTGDDDKSSCGLWDPSREELLVSAADQKDAQNTMRHEAFHQYLHYATGNGNHAMWFNEGHATFFENVRYNGANNTVRVVDEGNRAMWVSRSPEAHARHMKNILRMTHEQFYSGDMNLNYCTAWALTYFLEKGAYTAKEFEPYRKVLPKYLELTAGGMDALKATEEAFKEVEGRDLAADFLSFWKRYRKSAQNARQGY